MPGPVAACNPAPSTTMTAPAITPSRRTRSHGAGHRSRLRTTSHGRGQVGGLAKIRRPELTVPWRTLAGWADEPGQLTRMGAITAEVARELARAAAADPACVWRVVVTDARGQVITVTRMRWPGRTLRKSGHPPGELLIHRAQILPRRNCRMRRGVPGAPRPAGPERGVPGPGAPGPAVPERGAPRPGVLGRITVTVPVTLLGEPTPAALARVNATRGSVTSAGLVAVLQAVLTAGAAAVREVGRPDPGLQRW